MKEFQIRVKDGSKGTAEAMGQMSQATQQVWKDFNAGKGTVKDVHNAVIAELKGMDDQIAANNIGVGLYGTKWEDLEQEAMYALGGIDGALVGVGGTMQNMVDVQEQTFGQRFQSMLRELKASLIPLGKVLLTIGETWLPKISAAVTKLSDGFNNMSPAMQKAVVVGGMIVAAIGPIITIVGSLIGSFASVAGAIGAAGGATAILSGAFAFLTGPIGLAIAAIAAITVGTIALVKHFKKASVESDIFGDNVSESTKKAVSAYVDMDKEATVALNNMAWGQQVVTEGMANTLIGQYKTMGDQVLTEMKADHTEQLDQTQKMFAQSSALTEAEEAKALEKLKQSHEAQQHAVDYGQQKIAEILNKAKEEKRAITENERIQIENIQEGMKTKAVQLMSESQAEQIAILEAMNQQKGELNAEAVAATVAKAIEQKEAVVSEANAQYDQTLANIVRMRDETGSITAEQADKMIEEATRQRDETVKKATETHEKVIEQAKLQAGEHVAQVDWETGQIKSKWDIFKDKLGVVMSTIGSFMKTAWASISSTAVQISTSLGAYVLGKFNDMKTGITDKLNGAKDAVSRALNAISGFFANLKLAFPKIKVPSFTISGSFNFNPPSVPSIGISWNKKGGYLDDTSIVGTQGGMLAGAGEAGREAILPLQHQRFLAPFAEAIAKQLPQNDNEGITNNFNIASLVVREEADIQKISRELYRLIDNRKRGGGRR